MSIRLDFPVAPAVAQARRGWLTVRPAHEWAAIVCWLALFGNVLAFAGVVTIVPIPPALGQLIAQSLLAVACLAGLLANPGLLMARNTYLIGLALLALLGMLTCLHADFLAGATFRAARFGAFVVCLWLLTPWFARRDLFLLRCHRLALWLVLATVVLGAFASPGLAFAFEGRLSGVIWPIPPTQVAHYAAVLAGTTAILWTCRVLSGRAALIGFVLPIGILLLTHTRTALVASAVALVAAAAALFVDHRRVRGATVIGTVFVLAIGTTFASEIVSWATRGQDSEQLGQLTGRTKVWSAVVNLTRPWTEDLFGSGLTNQSFGGLPIDSNWVATWLDLGWAGVLVQAVTLILLLIAALTAPRGPQRGCAVFLVIYCLFASVTETGLGAPSPYLLDLSVAAALCCRRGADRADD